MPQSAAAWQHAGAMLALVVAALLPATGLSIQPRVEGHFLTNHELSNISSVDCLEAKQKDPTFKCKSENYTSFVGKISAGNFPDYQDSVCKSVNGEFFCDPKGLLTVKERTSLAVELKRLREDNLVVCGKQLNDKVDPRHLQPFYLGVVLLSEWPMVEADPESLQQLGQIIASQWNMDKLYAGEPAGRLTCPTTGVLLVLPDLRQAYLSTPSCEFICQAHGGPEVITATVKAWHNHAKLDGVLAGMRAAYKILGESNPLRPKPTNIAADGTESSIEASSESSLKVPEQEVSPQESNNSESIGSMSNAIQRLVFGFVVICFGLSLVTGFLLLLLGPGFLASRRK